MHPVTQMQTNWNLQLVTLSVVIAIIGSYVALDFAGRMKANTGGIRKLWFAGGAFMMGLAIWSMHFVGMMALDMGMSVSYNETLSALSMLAAAVGAGIAFAIMNRKSIGKLHLSFGSIAMGLAIASMHYIGMASMRMNAKIVYNPFLFYLSVLIAITASAGALWLAFKMRTDRPNIWFIQKIGSALVMGVAISGMHYTGMLAASYIHIEPTTSGIELAPMVGHFKLSDLLILASAVFGFALLALGAQTAGERQRALDSVQKSREREQLVAELIDSIRAESELQTILKQTVNHIGQFTQADHCSIWLYDSTNHQSKLEYEYGHTKKILSATEATSALQPILPFIIGKTIIHYPDVYQAEELTEQDQDSIRQRGIKSLLHVPILFKDDLLGFLRIHTVQEKREWNPENLALIKHIAAQAAIAIYHAKMLQELQTSEARKAGVLESSLDAIITVDHTGKVCEWNASAERILGYSRQEALEQELARLIIPEPQQNLFRHGLSHYLNTQESPYIDKLVELPIMRADASVFPAELTITRLPINGPPMFTSTLRDITERKKNQEELEKLNQELEWRVHERTKQLEETSAELRVNEKRFRLLINTVKDYAIFRLDPDGFIQTWNQGAERIKGYTAEEIIGQHFSKFYPQEALDIDYPAYELANAKEQGYFEDEGWRIRKDGSWFWANVVITALYDEQGNITGFTKIARDLTERKKAEVELQELADSLRQKSTELEAVNKELEAFSYSVSHDLRAPLRSIDGFSQAVYIDYADKLDDTAKRYLTRVREGCHQMSQLIDDILQLSRITRGGITIETQVSLSEIAKTIADELQQQNPERHAQFHIAENMRVAGDRRLLKSVLWNLLDNAWKYTSKHETAAIEFGQYQVDDKSIYYVKDDGAGFNMLYADKLFGAFQRLHRAKEFSGTGVGLASVARIIHRHGGEVWAEGEEERGATFYFTLNPQIAGRESNDEAQQPLQNHTSGRR